MNTIINEVTKAISKEVSDSMTAKDIVTLFLGKDGILPIFGRDFWIANYKISVNIK